MERKDALSPLTEPHTRAASAGVDGLGGNTITGRRSAGSLDNKVFPWEPSCEPNHERLVSTIQA